MSVVQTYSKVIFLSDGTTSLFPFSFKIWKTTDIIVQLFNISTGVVSNPLILDTDYTVSMDTLAPSTGNVTLIGSYAALATGSKIIIFRLLPLTQLIEMMDNVGTPEATFEEVFDRAVMLIQQLQEQLSRAVLQDPTKLNPFGLPQPVGGDLIGWNEAGDALINYPYPTLLAQLINGYIYFIIPETTLVTGMDKVGRIPIDFNGTIKEVLAEISTAPVGASVICDIKKNGTSIWSVTPGNKVTIADGANSGLSNNFDSPSIIQGDYLTIDVSQIGSTTPGTKLVVRVKIQKS